MNTAMNTRIIYLHSDPQYYGSECTQNEADRLNITLEAAARMARYECIIDPSRRDDDNPGIDWFAQAMAGGWDWTAEQWADWLKKQ